VFSRLTGDSEIQKTQGLGKRKKGKRRYFSGKRPCLWGDSVPVERRISLLEGVRGSDRPTFAGGPFQR